MSGPVARRVVIHGRVQGVFFRDSTRSEAERHGVAGWVANEDDGTVTAHLEGDADAIDALIAWCRGGPPQAQVERIDVEDAAPEGLDGFAVR